MSGCAITNARRISGFTLIEVLVAFLVFAIIGVISSQLLGQSVRSQEELSERGARLGQIHRAMQIIQRDLMQITDRPIRDELGDPLQPILIIPDGAIEFSRRGWRNPLQLRRAETQRTGYLLQNNTLFRGYWRVLDRAQNSEPLQQTLLEDVELAEFIAIDNAGNEHAFWPQPGATGPAAVLAGIKLRLEIAPFGLIERVWEVPSV